jgi:hypothetical protein
LLWHTGGSQTDVASIHAEDVNWTERIIFYRRKKNKEHAMPLFGDEAAVMLKLRPNLGPLFPYLITIREADRATEFKQRCNGLGSQRLQPALGEDGPGAPPAAPAI